MDTITPADSVAATLDVSDFDPDVDLATLSTETVLRLAADSSARITREKARFVHYSREIGKREAWRAEGERHWKPGWWSVAESPEPPPGCTPMWGNNWKDVPI